MAKYTTKNGDMLDLICFKYYGTTEVTTKVLEVNRELAKQGPILPAGIVIDLPEIEKPTIKRKVTLW
ncbi:tail protein X [Thiotrichales bacterium 19X7-9]|nr:tail protein X [Thiotrichales bacterium 19X7-9]